MPIKHNVLTFISRVKPEKADDLRELLKPIQDVPENNALVPFGQLKSLHFASFVLHEPTKDDEKKEYGPYLVFENNFDGTLESYLDDLHENAGPGLHQIYGHCQDYTVKNAGDRPGMQAYLKGHVVRPNAYHIGNTGRGVQRIIQERDLRDALETRADALLQEGKAGSASELFDTLKKFVAANPQFSHLPEPGPRQTFLQRFLSWINLVLQFALVLAVIVLLLPVVIILVLVLLHKEKTDSVKSGAADDVNIRRLVESEDHTHSVQNHMASITIVKDGWLRRLTLWLVLWAVNLLARARATHGELSGIPSIHFAHWSMIDGGRRLLFLSNFDGSWENYLDDFIDKAHTGLTAVWSNTVDFPRTQYLVQGGATDGPRFKAVARDSQTVTNAWYSAYRDLTVQGIDNNSSIREELRASQPNAQVWLHRL
jgi:hypothetical protein